MVNAGCTHMTINIKDSLSMVSSVIGYFIKLINMDHVTLHINVWDERLYNLLDQLSLVHTFNVSVKKIIIPRGACEPPLFSFQSSDF